MREESTGVERVGGSRKGEKKKEWKERVRGEERRTEKAKVGNLDDSIPQVSCRFQLVRYLLKIVT